MYDIDINLCPIILERAGVLDTRLRGGTQGVQDSINR